MIERLVERTLDLAEALERKEIRWTPGGKVNFRGERVGHLPSSGFNVEIHNGRPVLNGDLRLLDSNAHVESELRRAFNEALTEFFNGGAEKRGPVDEAVEAAKRGLRALFENRI